jgi:hypothetical protein
MKSIYYLLSGLTFGILPFMKFPQAKISNDLIQASLYLPDVQKGYYRATRFDWSGNMSSLKYKGHDYFGQWFKDYDPESHESVMGPVEDFSVSGFPDIEPGGSFVKIGVGVLTKPDDTPYSFSRLYPVINHGNWEVEKESDRIKFIHTLDDPACSYQYEKTMSLTKGKPELVISHILRNRGDNVIETTVYNHNFFMIDRQPVGPGYSVKLLFDIKGEGLGIGELAEIAGSEIYFLKKLKSDETVYCPSLEGFGHDISDYDIRIENSLAGAGVHITCDRPLYKLAFWSNALTVCPEPFIKIKADPGEEFSWEIRYNFYTLTE